MTTNRRTGAPEGEVTRKIIKRAEGFLESTDVSHTTDDCKRKIDYNIGRIVLVKDMMKESSNNKLVLFIVHIPPISTKPLHITK